MSKDSERLLHVLIVEDSDDDADLLKHNLESAGFRIRMERVDTRKALIGALQRKHWHIVFSDFSMPNFDGMEALKIVRQHDRDLPFIVVSGTIGEERAVQLMKLGAQDYLIKDNIRRLIPAVERELKEMRLRREHRLAQEHIQRLAYYDSLTQLPNRHRLLEDLQQRLPLKRGLVLMVINLRNFREINATLGYGNGDELIREAAARMQAMRYDDAELYHLYGNEFALLIVNTDCSHVETVARDVLKSVGSHYSAGGYRVHVGARIGIVAGADEEPSVLLQRADLAATLAKHESKGYAWYEPDRDPTGPHRLALLADLHDAVGTEQLFLAFQPKVQSGTGAITGCEALLRWQHPTQGLIMPETFIDMGEQSGVIDDITRHVLLRAARQLGDWHRRGLTLPIAINLSARNLQNPQLMSEILHAATLHARHGGLEIEITETALMRDPDSAMTMLAELCDAGVRISIDDFGIGFSSLGYLKRLPIHAVKIDQSFVVDLAHNPDSDAIVRSTIGLAHNLGLKVVAEGVENRAIWQRLTNYQCDEGQGIYFGNPLPAADLETSLGAWLPRAYAHQ